MFNSYIKRSYSLLVSFFLIFVISTSSYAGVAVPDVDPADAAAVAKAKTGMDLFKADCTACHAIDRKVIGPALADVWDKWDTEENLIAWVKNSQAVIKSGHAHANKIYEEYNKMPMPAFPTLSDEQVKDVFLYMKAAEKGFDPSNPGGKKETADAAGGATTEGADSGKSNTTLILVGLFAVLAILGAVLFNITSKLSKIAKVAQGESLDAIEAVEAASKKALVKKLGVVAVIIAAVLLLFNIGNGAINLGRSQGYKPEQPIRFSHALHVGQNKIECQYCHTGVEKSRHASIPGTQICMNCHKYVQEGPKYGKDEIKKIYDYSGWDPDKGAFVKAPKNIEWVQIHNLPDHVYFNHSQHVKVGKIECQTCHGKIEEMETVEQFAPLSMGWCINCHRETKVQFADNNYYSVFEKYHDEIKKGKRAGVTVEDIGGTECQKCHY